MQLRNGGLLLATWTADGHGNAGHNMDTSRTQRKQPSLTSTRAPFTMALAAQSTPVDALRQHMPQCPGPAARGPAPVAAVAAEASATGLLSWLSRSCSRVGVGGSKCGVVFFFH